MALRGSTGIPGAGQKVWLQCIDKCLDHQAIPNAEWRKENNLGQECLPRQAADVQLARYYCSAQRYTEVAQLGQWTKISLLLRWRSWQGIKT